MIIATAGHVDHGKTTLIQALTGEDTDRLAEEKRRGLTIDLGFAWTRTRQGHWLGFVDVPGHEKFIRNMVAGVSAVDAVMLVVAADDGPMPQTREHLAILDLLGVSRGLVALTRTDRVDSRRLAAARADVAELLAPTALAGAPVFPVSGVSGEGMPALLTWLSEQAEQIARRRQPSDSAQNAGTRLVVDRSFSVKGSGCVVTGTLLSGRLNREDDLMLSPAGLPARVRGLQIHGESVARVNAGQRCAVNLAGDLRQSDVHRGDWLVGPWLHHPADRLDVALTLLPEVRLHRGSFQVHIGTAVRSAKVVLLAPASDEAPALAQLMLSQPVQACAGDRWILRDPALNRTVGGGQVIDPSGWRRGRSGASRTDLLRQLAGADSAVRRFDILLAAGPGGVLLEPFARASNLPEDSLDDLLASRRPVVLSGHSGRRAVAADRWRDLQQHLLLRLGRWHEEYPDRIGPAETELTGMPGLRLDPELRHGLLRALQDEGEVTRNGFRFHRPGHRPVLAQQDQALLDRVIAQIQGTGLKPPIVGELAEALGLERQEMLAFLERMHRRGVLVAVAPNRFYTPATATELADIAVELARASPTGAFDARAYNERTGIGRRLTVSVLEYLDRAGVTAFINNERRLQPAYRRQIEARNTNGRKTG